MQMACLPVGKLPAIEDAVQTGARPEMRQRLLAFLRKEIDWGKTYWARNKKTRWPASPNSRPRSLSRQVKQMKASFRFRLPMLPMAQYVSHGLAC